MFKKKLGVVAIGNALVDVLSNTTDAFINDQNKKHGMEKGAMTLIEEARAVELYSLMGPGVESSGGSAANTMAGFASFGGKGGFIGKIADDELGHVFQHDIRSAGIEFDTQPLLFGAPTGRCLVLITPDAQRTMNTFLGASVELSPHDIDTDLIASAKVTYLEGYLFDRKLAKEAFFIGAEAAKNAGNKVSLTLSDPFCVDRHRYDFNKLVADHVDILFSNEDELKSLFQCDIDEAKQKVKGLCEVVVLTQGAKGLTILTKDEEIQVPAIAIPKVVDTTGAGDSVAAGFFYGYTEGMPLQRCGQLGTLAASEIISHVGPRPQTKLAELLKKAA